MPHPPREGQTGGMTDSPVSDVDLVHAITRELRATADLNPAAVHVTAEAGRVRLRGVVATHAERLAAATVSEAVAGVTGVVNDLVVRDLDLADAKLTDAEVVQQVERALAESTVRIQRLEVGCRQHVVTLRGEVASSADRAAARHAAQYARGVHVVDDLLTVADAADGEVEELAPDDSIALLGREGVGRLGVRAGAGVDIYPVNYRVHGRDLFFKSGPGTKMIRLVDEPEVAFEADGRDGGHVWSVVVKGVVSRLDDDTEILAAGIVEAPTAHPGEKLNYLHLRSQQITGRRFPMSGVASSLEG